MKKLILPILIFISIRSMGQCDSAMLSQWVGMGNDMLLDSVIGKGGGDIGQPKTLYLYGSPTGSATWSTTKRHIVRLNEDSAHIYYHKTKNYDSKVSWDAETNRDTIKFITPPHKIIIGHTSYTSMFLNGSWILLMDYKDVN